MTMVWVIGYTLWRMLAEMCAWCALEATRAAAGAAADALAAIANALSKLHASVSSVLVLDPLFSVQRWWRNGGRECGIAIALLPTPSVGTGPLFMARTMSALSLSLYHDRCGFNVEVDGNAGEIAERLAYRASLRAA
jgi:hypothetical protein